MADVLGTTLSMPAKLHLEVIHGSNAYVPDHLIGVKKIAPWRMAFDGQNVFLEHIATRFGFFLKHFDPWSEYIFEVAKEMP